MKINWQKEQTWLDEKLWIIVTSCDLFIFYDYKIIKILEISSD